MKDTKRENFDVTPEQDAAIAALQELLGASSRKDAVLTAVKLSLQLATEARNGNQIFLKHPGEATMTRVLILGLDSNPSSEWKYLIQRPHPWKKQLYVKGRKLPAANVWSTSEGRTPEELADDWYLPVEAVNEIMRYCEANKELLEMEALEELRILRARGFRIERPTIS